jgi:hypothetical protein
MISDVQSKILEGALRFGLDRLGSPSAEDPGDAASGLPVKACHPYGLRSRPRDADTDADGNPTEGAGLLLLDFGGGDEGGIPTQDPRVELVDEGKGGAQIYAWTGSAVSSVVLSGDDGKVRVTAPETVIGFFSINPAELENADAKTSTAIDALHDITAADMVTAVMSYSVESGKDYATVLKEVYAILRGKFVANAADPTSVEFYAPDGTTVRVTHTLTDTTRTPS